VLSLGAVDRPELIDFYVDLAAQRASRAGVNGKEA
jgi:hypothetical protein